MPRELVRYVFLLPATVSVTFTPETTPPAEEETVPVIVPLTTCRSGVLAEAVFELVDTFPVASLARTK